MARQPTNNNNNNNNNKESSEGVLPVKLDGLNETRQQDTRLFAVDDREKYRKELKALNVLYGKMMSEEKLLEILKRNDGDSAKAMEEIVSNIIGVDRQYSLTSFSSSSSSISVDSLYEQRLLEIDGIVDIALKSKKILLYACLYASDGKNDVFVKLMERYGKSGQIQINTTFDYNGLEMDLLTHLVNPLSANNVKCARYLLESELIKSHDSQVTEALQCAIKFQNEQAIKLLMSVKDLEEKQLKEREYAANYLKEKEKSELMLHYLKKNSSSLQEYEQILKIFCKCIQGLIKDEKIIPGELFNVCWIFDQTSMWDCIYEKCQQLLSVDNNIHKNAYQWQWLMQHLIENTQLLCWLTSCSSNEYISGIGNDDNKNDDKNNGNNQSHTKYEELKKFCMTQCDLQTKQNISKIKEEMEKNEDIMAELIKWKYESDVKYKNKNNCRQDATKYGLQSQCTLKELLQIQMNSNDMSFHPKHIYDYDVYLSGLLTRAHIMDNSFQQEMQEIFINSNMTPCIFSRGPIKSHERCKMKAQVEYADCIFPKCAHIVDVIRCQITYDTFADLKLGLNHFMDCIKKKSELFQIMRVKNGFAAAAATTTIQKSDEKEEEKEVYTKKLKLIVPQQYQDIKINIIYTLNQQSIVGEVQLLVKSMSLLKEKQHPLYEICRLNDFILSSSQQIIRNSFNAQLQMAGFHPYALAPLMLFYPLQFQTSHFILTEKDDEGQNFTSRMAFNQNVQYQCAKQLLQSDEFIPLSIVHQQLIEPDEIGTYALMNALWKQSSIECIELFVPPQGTNHHDTIWHELNTLNMSCIDYAVRNTSVNISLLLKWLKKKINDEKKWQKLIITQDVAQGKTPLMTAVLSQPNLSKEVIELLIPDNYKDNHTFWETRCTPQFDQNTLLHLAFGYSLPNLWNRLTVLNEYVPSDSWQKMLCTTDTYGYTPLMCSIYWSSETDEKIISLLIPNQNKNIFWRMTVNEKAHRTQGCSVLHLAIMNEEEEDNLLNRLQCLRVQMGEDMWKELLHMKNKTLLKESPAEMVRRLNKPLQILTELS